MIDFEFAMLLTGLNDSKIEETQMIKARFSPGYGLKMLFVYSYTTP